MVARSIEYKLSADVRDAVRGTDKLADHSQRAGRQVSALEKRLQQLSRGDVEARVNLDSDEARQRLTGMQARLQQFGSTVAEAKTRVDDADSQAKLSAIESRLLRVGATTADPNIDLAGVAAAEADLATLQGQLNRFDGDHQARLSVSGAQRTSRSLSRVEGGMGRITDGISGVLSGLAGLGKAGPIVLGAVAAAAVVAAGEIVAIGAAGAVAAGGIGAAFAGIGLGASLYAQTARGKQALEQFKNQARTILSGTAAPLFASFDRALDQTMRLLLRTQPVLSDVFSTLGGVVTRGVDRATSALETLAPSLGGIVRAGSMFYDTFSSMFGVIANRLAPALTNLQGTLAVVSAILGQQLGTALSRLLPQLVRLGQRALPLLPFLFKAVTATLGGLIKVANFAISVIGGMVLDFDRVKLAVDQARLGFNQLLNALPMVNRQAQIAAIKTQVLADKNTIAGTKALFFGQQSKRLGGQLGTLSGTVVGATGKTTVFGTRIGRTTQEMLAQYRKTNNLRGAISLLNRTMQGSINKEIAYESAIDNTTGALRFNNGKVLLNTQRQRNGAQAMVASTSAAEDLLVKYNKQGRSARFVSKETDRMRKELVDQAMELGATRKQAQRLIDKYFNIPNNVSTYVKTPGLAAAINRSQAFEESLESLERKYNVRISVGDERGGIPHGAATGGRIHAPGTGTSDSGQIRVSDDEYVVKAQSSRSIGYDTLNHINRTGQLPGFADGGRVTPEIIARYSSGFMSRLASWAGRLKPTGGRALAWARTQDGKPYQWGGTGNPSWDCSGFMSGITNVLRGRDPNSRLFSTHSFAGGSGAAGFVRGASSPFQIGVLPGSHMAGSLNGVNVESSGSYGVEVGAPARGATHPMFPYQFGLTGMGGSRSRAGLGDEGIRADRGALLPRGLNLVRNATSGAEHQAVFTTEQWRALKTIAQSVPRPVAPLAAAARGGDGVSSDVQPLIGSMTIQSSPSASAGELINEALHRTRVVRAGGR